MDGDTRLFNPYGVIVVNPKRHPHVKADLGQAFIDWLIGAEGQAAIGAFRINGEVLFKPNAMAVTHRRGRDPRKPTAPGASASGGRGRSAKTYTFV